MSNIQIYSNDTFGSVRTVYEGDDVLFCASDVAKALKYSNPRDAVSRHCRCVVKRYIPHPQSPDKQIEVSFIFEPDLYRLIFSSKLPDAEKFTDWVTKEVIPSIRKHGAYITPAKIEEILADPDIIINLATTLKEERAKRKELEVVVEEQKPLVEFANKVANTDKLISMGEMSKLLKDEHIDIGRNRLFKYLRDNKILTKKNLPYQRYVNSGYFQVKETSNSNGVFLTTYVTGKGQMYLVKLAKKLITEK